MVDVGLDAVHEATATLLVLLVEQVVVVQPLPEVALEPEHDATATLLVLLGVHVVAVKLLLEDAGLGEQELTAVGPDVTTGQVVAT